jgi:multidrug transporter EmrE-like cation transporter
MLVKTLPFIFFTVFANAAAQIMLKKGMLSVGTMSFGLGNVTDGFVKSVMNPYIALGAVIYVLAMVAHLFVLSRIDLSIAYPFLSLAYVVTAAYAFFVFKEDLNALRCGGIVLICLGTFFVARS